MPLMLAQGLALCHTRAPKRGATMDCVDLDALEGQAKALMAPASYAFAACGADDEVSLAENTAAWRSLRLRPRVLRDVTAIDMSTTILGQRMPTPLMIAPTGRHKLYHPQGERAPARGAALASVPYVMASNSNILIEDVAAERKSAPQWFQLYYWPNRAEVEALIDRLGAHGFRAPGPPGDRPRPGGALGVSSRFCRQGDLSGGMARTGMAGEALADTGAGQGRVARRRCRGLRRARRARSDRVQPWRAPTSHKHAD